MPRKAKGPRLYLRERTGREAVWCVRDGKREISTGCGASDTAGAEEKFGAYLTDKYKPPKTKGRLSRTVIADVLNLYLKEHAPTRPDKGVWIGYMTAPILEHWGEMFLSDVNKTSCQAYVKWRLAQAVSDQTARHELTVLRAAIRYYHASEYGPLEAVPIVTVPEKAGHKIDYWLTREQVAKRIRVARRLDRCGHIARMLLIGVYTGTRPGAIMALRWIPSTSGGWFDMSSETLHRRAQGRNETKKRQPPARIHARLLPHLKRWKRKDEEKGISYVCHYYGKPTRRIKRAWAAVAIEAGHATQIGTDKKGKPKWKVHDGPHICRHTAATWQMQAGTSLAEAAGYLGMNPDTLWDVYGHHSPAFQSGAATASSKKKLKETNRLTPPQKRP